MGLSIEEQDRLLDEFYSKKYYASYSALNKLLYSPMTFYNQYVLQVYEEKMDSYLIDGKVIHCLLLDNGSFNQQFSLVPGNLPGASTRTVVDKVFQIHKADPEANELQTLAHMEDAILNVLKEINLHQSLKTDKQRIEKIVSAETESYWQFLKTKGNKDLIDQDVLNRCTEAVDILRYHPQVSQLLGVNISEFDNVAVYNEHTLKADTKYAFGLKGIVDNIKIDYETKTVYINDLKTTGKTIADFPETVEFYNYWMQAAIYIRLVFANSGFITPEWRLKFNFIVIDKYNQVYCFEVSEATILVWQEKLESTLREFDWHYMNKNYSLPYKFLTGQVVL